MLSFFVFFCESCTNAVEKQRIEIAKEEEVEIAKEEEVEIAKEEEVEIAKEEEVEIAKEEAPNLQSSPRINDFLEVTKYKTMLKQLHKAQAKVIDDLLSSMDISQISETIGFKVYSWLKTHLSISSYSDSPQLEEAEFMKVVNSQYFDEVKKNISRFAFSDRHKTQCGEITSLSEVGSELSYVNFDLPENSTPSGRKYDKLKGMVYLLKFKPKNKDGSISDRSVVSLIALPDHSKPKPFTLWNHPIESATYASIAHHVGALQEDSIVGMLGRPGETLKNKDKEIGVSEIQEESLGVFDSDVQTNLAFLDCINILNNSKEISSPPVLLVKNPFYNRFKRNMHGTVDTMVSGYSLGGSIAIQTASLAGQLIEHIQNEKIKDLDFRPHFIRGIATIAPGGSLLTGMFLNFTHLHLIGKSDVMGIGLYEPRQWAAFAFLKERIELWSKYKFSIDRAVADLCKLDLAFSYYFSKVALTKSSNYQEKSKFLLFRNDVDIFSNLQSHSLALKYWMEPNCEFFDLRFKNQKTEEDSHDYRFSIFDEISTNVKPFKMIQPEDCFHKQMINLIKSVFFKTSRAK